MDPSADAPLLSRVNTWSRRPSSSARSLCNSRMRFSALCNLTYSTSSEFGFFLDCGSDEVGLDFAKAVNDTHSSRRSG
jgi:hypothetical protein